MLIEVQPPYVPLDIKLDDEIVRVYVNTTIGGLAEIGDKCHEAARKFGEKEPEIAQAMKDDDLDAILAINEELAPITEEAIRSAIGDGYDQIMNTLANIAPEFKPSDANHVMSKTLDAISQIVKDAKAEMITNKAAHYLSEVSNAQALADV